MYRIIKSAALILALNAGFLTAQEPIPDALHDYLVTMETDSGNMMMLLFDDTPMHKENFAALAKAGVYDGNTFHRVIEHFMIQSGDPSSSNITPSWNRDVIPSHVPAEIKPSFRHRRGTVGAARYGGESPGPFISFFALGFYSFGSSEQIGIFIFLSFKSQYETIS